MHASQKIGSMSAVNRIDHSEWIQGQQDWIRQLFLEDIQKKEIVLRNQRRRQDFVRNLQEKQIPLKIKLLIREMERQTGKTYFDVKCTARKDEFYFRIRKNGKNKRAPAFGLTLSVFSGGVLLTGWKELAGRWLSHHYHGSFKISSLFNLPLAYLGHPGYSYPRYRYGSKHPRRIRRKTIHRTRLLPAELSDQDLREFLAFLLHDGDSSFLPRLFKRRALSTDPLIVKEPLRCGPAVHHTA
jgi:hypothetical protein